MEQLKIRVGPYWDSPEFPIVCKLTNSQIETAFEHDAVGREKVRIAAKNTPVEPRTETDYDLFGNVTEVRSPRFFDSTDTHGHNKAKQTWTYTGRNLVASSTEAPGTPESATESFVYLLRANGCY